MAAVPDAATQLGDLAALVGEWEGAGRGSWDTRPEFRYREHLTFHFGGKPLLSYVQQTWALDDGRPLHSEQGYFRAVEDGSVELVLAHSIGVVEIGLGAMGPDGLHVRSSEIRLTPTAKAVTALDRRIAVAGDELRYTLDMAMAGGVLRPHLSGALRRIAL